MSAMEGWERFRDSIIMELPSPNSNRKILIAGGGPAGLVLGILLRRLDYETHIIEKEEAPHRPVCGEFLCPEGNLWMNKLGLGESLAGFAPIEGMRLVSPKGRQVLAAYPDRGQGLAINRQTFQSRLSQIFVRAGGTLHAGEQVEAIQVHSGHIELKTNRLAYHADAIVGADGRQSAIAKLGGLGSGEKNGRRIAIHAYVSPKEPRGSFGYMQILSDGSYVGINPISSSELNLSIVTDAENLSAFESPRDFLVNRIQSNKLLREWINVGEIQTVKTTSPISCRRNAVARGKIALIGDASGFIDPLTGEGITTAIKTAALLAEKLRHQGSITDAFSEYGKARKREFRQKERLNRALQYVIRAPVACELIAALLQFSPRLRQLFIGVIGNVFTPAEALGRLVVISRTERET